MPHTQIIIRPYEEVDASEMHAAVLESVAEVAPWMVWCTPDYSAADAADWVRTSSAGRGVAPAAMRQLISWTFEHTNLNRIEIVAAVNNVRSQRVAEKVSARRDAILKKRMMVGGQSVDAILYSIVRPD